MASSLRTPPRFVPTLTTVIEPVPEAVDAPASTAAVPPSIDPAQAVALGPVALSDADLFDVSEHLLYRVMQRVELSLEERLSDAVSAAVQVQLDAMVPQLRAEIEGVLRRLVAESLTAELSAYQGSQPFFPS